MAAPWSSSLFCMAILVPLLVGTIGIGTELVREIEVTQVCRDATHMHAYGVGFHSGGLIGLLFFKPLRPLELRQRAETGAIILSTIEMVSGADCEAGGSLPIQRIVLT